MGHLIFGLSILLVVIVLGIAWMVKVAGWRNTFEVFGICLAVISICALISIPIGIGMAEVFGG